MSIRCSPSGLANFSKSFTSRVMPPDGRYLGTNKNLFSLFLVIPNGYQEVIGIMG